MIATLNPPGSKAFSGSNGGSRKASPFSIRRFVRVLTGIRPDNFRQSEIRFWGSESPLEIAAMREHMKVVRILLGKGARRVNPRLDYHPAVRRILCSALSEFHAQANSV